MGDQAAHARYGTDAAGGMEVWSAWTSAVRLGSASRAHAWQPRPGVPSLRITDGLSEILIEPATGADGTLTEAGLEVMRQVVVAVHQWLDLAAHIAGCAVPQTPPMQGPPRGYRAVAVPPSDSRGYR